MPEPDRIAFGPREANARKRFQRYGVDEGFQAYIKVASELHVASTINGSKGPSRFAGDRGRKAERGGALSADPISRESAA